MWSSFKGECGRHFKFAFIFGTPQSNSLILSDSQFRELETGGYFIPAGPRDQVFHRKPVQEIDNSEDRLGANEDPDIHQEDVTEAIHADEQPAPNPGEAMRRSSRVKQPSMKLLEMISLQEDWGKRQMSC